MIGRLMKRKGSGGVKAPKIASVKPVSPIKAVGLSKPGEPGATLRRLLK